LPKAVAKNILCLLVFGLGLLASTSQAMGQAVAEAMADSARMSASEEKPQKVPRVPWIMDQSWAEVLDRAHTGDQPILIDFTATWCGPCKLLDVMVFTEKKVIERLAEVVTFQVDIDKPEYLRLKQDLNIEVVPTLVWCDKRGQEVDRFTGYVSSTQFLGILDGWQSNRTIDRVLSDRQSKSPQDAAVLLDVARRQAERGNDQQADVVYRRLMNLRRDADSRIVARGMLGLAKMEHRSGRVEEARQLATRLGALYAEPAAADYRQEGMMEVALFQESIGDTLGMLATFRGLAEADRRSVLALHGYARAAVKTGLDLVPATKAALRATVYSDNDPDVISTLAACYYWRGLYGKAIRWQNKAVAAAPHQKIYQAELELYIEARAGDPHGMRGPPQRSH